MKTFCKILFLFLGRALSNVFELQTDENGYLYISFNLISPANVSGSAPLLLGLHEHTIGTSPVVPGFTEFTTVDHVRIRTNSLLRRTPGTTSLYIPMGFRCAFATYFARQYMLIPMHRQLIRNPANPFDFVLGGRMIITQSTSDERPQVRVSVSLFNSAPGGELVPPTSAIVSTSISDFVISTVAEVDSIPESIIIALYEDLERRQIPLDPIRGLDGLRGFNIVGNLTEEVIDTFPIVQYRIPGDSGEDSIIQLEGKDYIGPFDGRLRRLLFCSFDFRILGRNTLSRVALYIDNANRRIGFGDPL